MPEDIYNWRNQQRLDQWRLEGHGETLVTDDGSLMVRTYNCGPHRKATNLWLKNVILPENFEIEWTFQSKAPAGNVMIIFNALPVVLRSIFDDPRPHARYSDLASYRKLICHTCGFHRAVYDRDSVLRKLGGNTPPNWGEALWGTPEWSTMNENTRMHVKREPLTPDDLGSEQQYLLTRTGNRIVIIIGGEVLHDISDTGEYPYYEEPLRGGHLAFRNFGGYAEDVYKNIVIREIKE